MRSSSELNDDLMGPRCLYDFNFPLGYQNLYMFNAQKTMKSFPNMIHKVFWCYRSVYIFVHVNTLDIHGWLWY